MKTIETFCRDNNLVLIKVKYTCNGVKLKRVGYDICRMDGHKKEILISFEPKSYNKEGIYKKDKYFIAHRFYGYRGPDYIGRITKAFLSTLDINGHTDIFVK